MSLSAPSIPSVSANLTFKQKVDLLWQTNKPLFIGIIALITLLVFAIIFCIVYFLVIRPRQAQSASTDTTVAKTAHMVYQSLRSFNHA
jgi:flagellar biosynthesis/type III secretory pathway M-ring protein FliF/YscJ